jgi:hypothetical protein
MPKTDDVGDDDSSPVGFFKSWPLLNIFLQGGLTEALGREGVRT